MLLNLWSEASDTVVTVEVVYVVGVSAVRDNIPVMLAS